MNAFLLTNLSFGIQLLIILKDLHSFHKVRKIDFPKMKYNFNFSLIKESKITRSNASSNNCYFLKEIDILNRLRQELNFFRTIQRRIKNIIF